MALGCIGGAMMFGADLDGVIRLRAHASAWLGRNISSPPQ
jgi:hypothetical protein